MLNDKIDVMNIIIQRSNPRNNYIHGLLKIDGVVVCDTLENANGCVPAGEYSITLRKCKQYARKMPLLNPNAPCAKCKKLPFVCNNTTLPCFCPMLKPGNGVYTRIDGSIILGQYHCLGSIIHPKAAFDSLYERIRKSIRRGNEVLLSVY